MSKFAGKILLLNGGGLDSCAQLMIGKGNGWDITSVHVDYGQAAALAEKRAVRKLSEFTKTEAHYVRVNRIDDLHVGQGGRRIEAKPLLPGHALTVNEPITDRVQFEMMGRNLMLLSIGLVLASKNFTYLMLANNTAPAYYADATPRFLQMFNTITTFLGGALAAIAPFSDMTKLEAVQKAYKISPIVLEAHSCYRAEECGVCPHCLQKKEIVAACVG